MGAADRAVGDQAFICRARFASQWLAVNGFEVFYYVLTHATTVPGPWHWNPAFDGEPIVYHGQEVPLVFMNVENATAEERILAEQVASYWFRHAAYGNPNGKANRAETITWPRYETKSEQYLQLDVKSMGGISAVRKPFRSETCDFSRSGLRSLRMQQRV